MGFFCDRDDAPIPMTDRSRTLTSMLHAVSEQESTPDQYARPSPDRRREFERWLDGCLVVARESIMHSYDAEIDDVHDRLASQVNERIRKICGFSAQSEPAKSEETSDERKDKSATGE